MAVYFFDTVFTILSASEVDEKLALLKQHQQVLSTYLSYPLQPEKNIRDIDQIGLPSKPELVTPKALKPRKLTSASGRAAMVHAIAHIEFNAINLALDACYRFQTMPAAYYADWLKVAYEEAKHFQLLNNHMQTLGYQYGDFVAHNGLWALAKQTDYDVLARMALVPRLMEARGLDVTPAIQEKFRAVNDLQMVEILDIIFAEEIGHVAIGNHWFHWLCQQRDCEPMSVFSTLLDRHIGRGGVKLPLNEVARIKAGFTEQELCLMNAMGVR